MIALKFYSLSILFLNMLSRQRIGTSVEFGGGSGLTKEEKEVIKETFELFDKDADGYLSPQELKRCLEGTINHRFFSAALI